MVASKHPLTQEDCDRCNEALHKGAMIREFLEKCERCGLDMEDAKNRLEGAMAFAHNVKREFFPMNP